MRSSRLLLLCTVITLVLAFSLTTQAATTWLKGQITEAASGKPIQGATVRVGQHKGIAITDANGSYLLKTELSGEQRLRVTCLGYTSREQPIQLVTGDTLAVSFAMTSSITEIRGVVVTGQQQEIDPQEAPQPVSVITPADFPEQDFSTTAEFLREQPGISVQKTTAGHGAPIIRGLIGKYVLLLFDGLRLNRPTFRFGANQYLDSFDQNWLSSVVVTRGPASVIYGSDAMGGAVNLVSYSPGFSSGAPQFVRSADLRYSSADEGYAVNSRIGLAATKFSGWAGITYKNIGDLRAGGEIGKQVPTGWDELNFATRLAYLFDQKELSIQYLSTKQNDVPRYDRYGDGFDQFIYDPQDRQLVILSLQSLQGEGRKTASRISLSYSKEDEGQTERKAGSDETTISDQTVETWGGFGQLTIVPTPDTRLTLGTEYYADQFTGSRVSVTLTDTTSELPVYPDGSTYNSFGLYSEYAFPIGFNWGGTAGLRYSRVTLETDLVEPFGLQNETFSNFTSSFSLIRHLTKETNLLLRWSRGFRAPNLNDLASLGTSSSGVDVPSPGVDPETSDDYEIGYRVDYDNLVGGAYLYYSRLHDLIDRRPGTYLGLTFYDDNDNGVQDPGERDVFQKKNVGEAEIYGLEFDAQYRLNDQYQLHTNLFYTKGENITDNEPLSRIPPLMGNLTFRRSFSPTSWVELLVRAATDQRRLSQRDIDDTRIGPEGTDGWQTLNLRGSFEWQTLRFVVVFMNLTDQGYREHGSGIDSPGRGVTLSVSY